MCGRTCAKFVLLIFNAVFFLTGALLLGVGVWAKLDPSIAKSLEQVNLDASAPLVQHAAYLLIGVGGLTFLVGFIGCCGAIREHNGLLFLYAFLLLIIMALEIAIAVIALIYRGKIESELKDKMKSQITNKFGVDAAVTSGWNNLQQKMKCCGADSYTDYIGSAFYNSSLPKHGGPLVNNSYVPNSCCNQFNEDVKDWRKQCMDEAKMKTPNPKILFSNGCHVSLDAWFKKHSLTLMIVAFVIGGIQIIGFVAACALRKARPDEKEG